MINIPKKHFKNAFICYLAILTGCTNTVQNTSNTSSLVNNKEAAKTAENNKYNLPTLDLKKPEEKITKSKKSIFEPSYTDATYQPVANPRDKTTGDSADLQAMATGVANSEVSDSVKEWFATRHATAELSLGAGESGIKTGSFDLLVPLVDSEKDLFFTQVGARRSNKLTEDYRNTVNLGLGYRHTLDKWLLGVNSFYDRDTTAGNERLGLGLEAWTDYLKLAGNSYMRLSDWRQSKAVEDYQERPANGWDLRAEAFLPQYPQLGGKVIYEQYYGDEVGLFGSSNRQKDPSAATLGLSYTPIPLISMSTDYRQGQNGMSETSVRLGLNFQLGVPLKKQLSADELRASRLLVNSRYNLVSRNNEIVLDFKKNETGYIVLPSQLKGTANDTVMFPVNITGEVRNITWTGTASAYARTYGGSTSASIVLPPYNNNGTNIYTLKAVGSDRYGKIVESNVMQIGVESLKIAVERSVATISANGADEVTFTATLTKNSGEIVPNSDLEWQVQGNANIVSKDSKTDTNGKARLRLNSLFASAVSVTVSEPAGAKAEADVTFVAQDSTAKVISINATPNTVHADGISTSTLVATVQDVNNKPVGAGTKVDWTTNLGTLSAVSSETDSTGKATVTINSNTLGTATVNANAVKGSANTTVVFDALPAIVNTLTLTANPESIPANGVSQSVFTVTIKDSNGNPVVNNNVNWSKNISDAVFSNPSSTTNSSGIATVTLTSGITAGNLTVTATTANGSGNKVIELTTIATQTSSIDLVASNNSIVANGSSTSTLTATLKDSNGNLMPANTKVEWNTNEGTLLNATSVTDANGKAINTLTSSIKATTATITANANSVSKTVDVKFVMDNLRVSSLSANPTSIKADDTETTTITAIVHDINGNAVGAGTRVMFSQSLQNYAELSSPSALTNGSGQASVTFKGSLATQVTIEANVENDGNYESINVTLTPNGNYTVSLTPPSARIKSDGIEEVALVANIKNSDGTNASNVKVLWQASGGNLTNQSSTTDSNGNASAKFTSTQEGNGFVAVVPVGSDGNNAAYSDIQVYDPNSSNSSVSINLTATKSSYDSDEDETDDSISGIATATLTDLNGSSVAGKNVLLECVAGCLSQDGTEAMPSVTRVTNSRGRITSSYSRINNMAAGDLILKATLVEDTNVYKTFNVSQNGLPDIPL